MSRRAMIQLSSMLVVQSFQMSWVKGYTEMTAESQRQSATAMKEYWSRKQVEQTRWKGQLGQRSFLISHLNVRVLTGYFYILISKTNLQAAAMIMHMSIKWQWAISFVFQSWTVHEHETGLIILGLVVTFLASVCSIALPALSQKVVKEIFRPKHKSSTLLIKERASDITQNEEEWEGPRTFNECLFNFFYVLLYSIVHIGVMMLIMTYNGYVILTVVLGLACGSFFFAKQAQKDKSLPVNCCAN